ncbi:MAG: hypothetical protein HY711_02145 [Candidatus Melainabacteria bacterium]|nr:hypothetical protein [Candidatus Melainabacteria bacterium]
MVDEKGRAQEIVRKLNQGDEHGAIGELQKAFFELRNPEAFKAVVQEMQSITSADKNSNNDIYYSTDDKGNIAKVYRNDAWLPFMDTKLLDTNDGKPMKKGPNVANPLETLKGAVNRAIDFTNSKMDDSKPK